MSRLKCTILSLLLIGPGLNSQAQEYVSTLQLIKEIKSEYSKSLSKHKSKAISDTLELPFFDDFSRSRIYPGDSLWADKDVYINNTYPVDQLSIGVASFDALNDRGLIYDHATTSIFEADHLTSDPINLEGDASDNFYLSFFYQPQGIGDAPGSSDSLTLQFWSVSNEEWYSVWKANGTEVHPFKPVILKIDDERFTSKGFRFRFINYASLAASPGDIAMSGNADQWHIDYVYLDRNRNAADTILHDVAFTKPIRSILNAYEAVPWTQFKDWYVSLLGPPLSMHYINNDDIERNTSRGFTIYNCYDDALVHTFPPFAKNSDPGAREQYDAPVSYLFNTSNEDSALFEIKASLITDAFDNKSNDTIVYHQVFKNYFAIDDGSAEGGYGINGQGANNAMAVVRFKSFNADTLRAISICFNDSYQNANQRLFDLVVVSSDNEVPGDIIYSQEEEMVDPGETIDGFVTYKLIDPVEVNGDFFVGWRQRSDTWLNGGLDLNTSHNGRLYYYYGGVWTASSVQGSLMIRPVVGKELPSTGINDIFDRAADMKVWPNPASDIVNIDLDGADLSNSKIEVYSSSGKKVLEYFGIREINIASLPEGLYMMRIIKNNLPYLQCKFIKTR